MLVVLNSQIWSLEKLEARHEVIQARQVLLLIAG
jgi:hypothetical protein